MSPDEFKSIRKQLGLSQPQLARVLGYADRFKIAALETTSTRSGRAVNPRLARLMQAYADGYRPQDWPSQPRGQFDGDR